MTDDARFEDGGEGPAASGRPRCRGSCGDLGAGAGCGLPDHRDALRPPSAAALRCCSTASAGRTAAAAERRAAPIERVPVGPGGRGCARTSQRRGSTGRTRDTVLSLLSLDFDGRGGRHRPPDPDAGRRRGDRARGRGAGGPAARRDAPLSRAVGQGAKARLTSGPNSFEGICKSFRRLSPHRWRLEGRLPRRAIWGRRERSAHARLPEHHRSWLRDRLCCASRARSAKRPRMWIEAVAAIIADVRARGDAAVIELTARFDRLDAHARDPRLHAGRNRGRNRHGHPRTAPRSNSPRRASAPITTARCRRTNSWTDAAGATLGWRWTPVSAAGLYVPGGLCLLSVLGADERDPRQGRGGRAAGHRAARRRTERSTRWSCWPRSIAGVDQIYRIGGAQAIAALAYGTETIAAGRQDHRPRQRLCRRRQAPGLRPGRHRHDRRPVRDPGDRRSPTTIPTGSRSTCSARPSMTKARSRS